MDQLAQICVGNIRAARFEKLCERVDFLLRRPRLKESLGEKIDNLARLGARVGRHEFAECRSDRA